MPFGLADPDRRLEAVELRHVAVHEEKVVLDALHRVDRLEAVGGDVGAMAELGEHAHRDLLIDLVVLHHEHAEPPRRLGLRSGGRRRRHVRVRRAGSPTRQRALHDLAKLRVTHRLHDRRRDALRLQHAGAVPLEPRRERR